MGSLKMHADVVDVSLSYDIMPHVGWGPLGIIVGLLDQERGAALLYDWCEITLSIAAQPGVAKI